MKRILIALTLITAVFASATCTRRGGNCADPGGTIKIGVYGDLTGQTSSFGQSTKNGADGSMRSMQRRHQRPSGTTYS